MSLQRNRHTPVLHIVLSFIAAYVLLLIPIPYVVRAYWPQWLLLALVYWQLATPHAIGLGWAWLLGLLLDVIYGSLLGEHAIALVLCAFIVRSLYLKLRMFTVGQQMITVALLAMISQLLLMMIQGMGGQLGNIRGFWISPLTTAMLWPVLHHFLESGGPRLVPSR